MGLIADRTHSRWGKYRPYLLFGALPYALLGCLLFLGPDLSDLGKLIFAYFTYTMVMLAFTAVNVPYSALLAVISPIAEERTKATQYRFVFASIGTLSVGALATPLVEWLGQGNEVLGFRLTIALFAVLSVALLWVTFLTTRERVEPTIQKSSVVQDIGALMKNWSWIVLVFAGIIIVIGLVARFASIVYYLKYYMVADEIMEGAKVFLWMDRVAFFTSAGLIGQLIGALLTPMLTRHFEKHHLMIAMNSLHALLLFVGYSVGSDQYALTVLLHFFGIFTFGVVITLLFSMYTDCVEFGEWQTGNNNAGLTVSASMFSLKFGSALGGALPGFFLAAFGFVANEAQSETTINGIRLMFTILPGALFFFGGLLMLFYKIDGETLRKIEYDLVHRRAGPGLATVTNG